MLCGPPGLAAASGDRLAFLVETCAAILARPDFVIGHVFVAHVIEQFVGDVIVRAAFLFALFGAIASARAAAFAVLADVRLAIIAIGVNVGDVRTVGALAGVTFVIEMH
jgi:hypothetical protein